MPSWRRSTRRSRTNTPRRSQAWCWTKRTRAGSWSGRRTCPCGWRETCDETTNERSNAMTYRENAKPKPMTQSDLAAEIARMQVEWDAAYAEFKKKVDPLELRELRLFKAAEEVAEEGR